MSLTRHRVTIPQVPAHAPDALDVVRDDVGGGGALCDNVVDAVRGLQLLAVEAGHGVGRHEAVEGVSAGPGSGGGVSGDWEASVS